MNCRTFSPNSRTRGKSHQHHHHYAIYTAHAAILLCHVLSYFRNCCFLVCFLCVLAISKSGFDRMSRLVLIQMYESDGDNKLNTKTGGGGRGEGTASFNCTCSVTK